MNNRDKDYFVSLKHRKFTNMCSRGEKIQFELVKAINSSVMLARHNMFNTMLINEIGRKNNLF